MAEDEQRASGGEHRNFGSRHLSDALAPNACSIHDHASAHHDVLAGEFAEQLQALDALLVDDDDSTSW